MHEEHVDVARVVELGAAQLAHADHGEGDLRLDDVERRAQTDLGERGELAADGRQVGDAEQVAHGDAEHLAPLPSPQDAARVLGFGERRCELEAIVIDGVLRAETLAVGEHLEERRVLDDRVRQRARRARDGDDSRARRRVLDDQRGRVGVCLDDALDRAPGQRGVGRRLDGLDDR